MKQIRWVPPNLTPPLKVRPANPLIFHKGVLGIVLVADFVNGFPLVLAHKEAVRAVDDEARFVADASVAVDHALGNDGRTRVVDAHGHFHTVPIGGAVRAVVPEGELEVAGAHPAEEVSLIHMLVGSAQNAGVRDAHIGHLRAEPGRQIVVAKDLRQPSTLVHELAEGRDHHALNGALFEFHDYFLPLLSGNGVVSPRASSLAWARLGKVPASVHHPWKVPKLIWPLAI